MYVYFISANTASWQRVKIGFAKDVEARLAEMQIGSPLKLNLMGKLKCESLENARALERSMHKTFHEYSVAGEWFALSQPLREFILATCEGDQVKATDALEWAERQMRTRAHKRTRYERRV